MNKERRLYKKAQKQYIKAMKSLLKESGPFEWRYMWDAIGLMVQRRLNYFTDGYNVWQIEESANEIKKSLQEAVRLWNLATNFKYTDDKEADEIFAKYGIDEFVKYLNTRPKRTEAEEQEYIKRCEKEAQEEQQAYENFFLYVGKHFREWWD